VALIVNEDYTLTYLKIHTFYFVIHSYFLIDLLIYSYQRLSICKHNSFIHSFLIHSPVKTYKFVL